MTNPEQFNSKSNPVTYTGAFVKLYNKRNNEQVHEIYGIIELEKIHASTTENLRNLATHWIIEISLVLRSAHTIVRDKNKFVFYVTNYID